MHQTGYKGITTFNSMLSFTGGFCQWYYTPKENIALWPEIDPKTQYLINEPLLIGGASWFGPVKVPDTQLGFVEEEQKTSAGIYYKQKVSGVYPGDSGPSRINLENMPYYEFVVVGKMRAGGLYLIIGNKDYGLDFLQTYKSGEGVKQNAGSEFSFGGDSLTKALLLTSFLGDNVTPPDEIIGGTTGAVTGQEIIFFTNQSEVLIQWTIARKANLGIFPTIQVWFTDEGTPHIARVPILVDAAPPNQTLFTIQNSGNATGFVHLSK
jgi:hypothetical protein